MFELYNYKYYDKSIIFVKFSERDLGYTIYKTIRFVYYQLYSSEISSPLPPT